jgi:hypothetical protein
MKESSAPTKLDEASKPTQKAQPWSVRNGEIQKEENVMTSTASKGDSPTI